MFLILWKYGKYSIPLNIMFSYNYNKWCHNVVKLLLETIVILLPVHVWKGNNVLFFNIMLFNGRVNAFKCLKSSQIVFELAPKIGMWVTCLSLHAWRTSHLASKLGPWQAWLPTHDKRWICSKWSLFEFLNAYRAN